MTHQSKRYSSRPVNQYLRHPAVQDACTVLPACSLGLRSTALTVLTEAFPEMPPRTRKAQQTILLRAPDGPHSSECPADFGFTPTDREATTTLMAALAALPKGRVTERINSEAVRFLRHVHGPAFNDDPTATLAAIDCLRAAANDTTRPMYELLLTHYQETLQLRDLLEHYVKKE